MSIHLPAPINLYVQIENSGDVQALPECFAPGAIVRDEGHAYEGLAAITRWKAETTASPTPLVPPVTSARFPSSSR